MCVNNIGKQKHFNIFEIKSTVSDQITKIQKEFISFFELKKKNQNLRKCNSVPEE